MHTISAVNFSKSASPHNVSIGPEFWGTAPLPDKAGSVAMLPSVAACSLPFLSPSLPLFPPLPLYFLHQPLHTSSHLNLTLTTQRTHPCWPAAHLHVSPTSNGRTRRILTHPLSTFTVTNG
jgi:hypothetical protein